MSPTRWASLRRILGWTTRFLLVLLGLLAVGELAVRTWIHAPAERVMDRRFGPRWQPDATVIESREGFGRHRTDEAGRFDRPLAGPVQERVLLLGDSYSVGQQVDHGERFSEVVETALPGVEIVNEANGGWYPPYYAAWLRAHEVEDYAAVVVQIGEGDLFELHRPDRIRLQRDESGHWELVTEPFPTTMAPLRRLSRRVSEVSALYELTRQRLRLLADQERERLRARFDPPTALAGGPEDAATGAGVENEVIPDDAVGMLVALHRMLVAEHARIVYLYVPRLSYERSEETLEWPEAREVFREFARRSGATLVDPTDRMQAAYERTGRPLHGFHNSVMGTGHLNAFGHHVVGTTLAEALRPRLEARAQTRSGTPATEGAGR